MPVHIKESLIKICEYKHIFRREIFEKRNSLFVNSLSFPILYHRINDSFFNINSII